MPNIIAEICQNHKGERSLIKELIHAAAEAGATHVKMQTIFSEDLAPRERFDEGEVEHNGVTKTIKRPYQTELERLKVLDITPEDHLFFIEEAQRAGVIPFTAVFSRIRIPMAASLPWPGRLVKIASYDCASHSMIKELLPHFDHFIVSTGATFDEEIEKTAKIINGAGKKLTLLHCVTSYPNTLEMANLTRMEWLRQFTPSVGWSDHTLVERDGVKAAKVAFMLGAEFVERHFTILGKGDTKDGPVSITSELLKDLSRFTKLSPEAMKEEVEREIPDWRAMLGHATRDMTHTEMLNRDYYRGRFASLVKGKWIYNWDEENVFEV